MLPHFNEKNAMSGQDEYIFIAEDYWDSVLISKSRKEGMYPWAFLIRMNTTYARLYINKFAETISTLAEKKYEAN